MRGRRPNYAWVDITLTERLARLMRKVQKRPDGCWEWIGKRFKNGYGQVCISFSPREHKYCLAHRVMWELHYGPLGKKKALHKCDHPWCVRPDHLFKGTTLDNCLDMHRKGRGNPSKGEAHVRSKLTVKKVLAIRAAGTRGDLHRVIAKRFGVCTKQVTVIIQRQQWKHV
jgi:hypothetical protein